MTDHLLGQTFSLLAALGWACALVLFKRSGERIPPVALNLFKNAVGIVLFGATLAILIVSGQERFDTLGQRSSADLGWLVLSGVLGIALADTLLFYALNLIGVGLLSIVDCCYSPLVILFSWLLLSEQLTAFHYVGAALVVAGVFNASQHARPAHRTRGQIVGGALLAVLAIALMALGIVIAKPVLQETPVVWATSVRLVAGSVPLALFALLGRDWQANWAVFKPSVSWRSALPAAVLGTYLSLVLWIAGFKYTYASVAAVLNQTSVVFSSVLAALVLKEQFGRRQVAALVLALTGVAIVTFSDGLQTAWRGLLAAVLASG